MRRLHGPAMTALTVLLVFVAVGPWVVYVAMWFMPDAPAGYLPVPLAAMVFLGIVLFPLQWAVGAVVVALYGTYRLVRYLQARRGPDDGVTAGGGAQ